MGEAARKRKEQERADRIRKGDTVQVRRSKNDRHGGEIGVVTKIFARGNCQVTVGNATFSIDIGHLRKWRDGKFPGIYEEVNCNRRDPRKTSSPRSKREGHRGRRLAFSDWIPACVKSGYNYVKNAVSPKKDKLAVNDKSNGSEARKPIILAVRKPGDFDDAPVLDNRHKSPSYADFHPMPVVTDFDGNVVSPSKKDKLTAADYEKMSVSEMNAAAGLTLTVTRK